MPTNDDYDAILDAAADAAVSFGETPYPERADFLLAIIDALEAVGDDLVATAERETHLGTERLTGELGRTTAQLRMFADLVRDGGHAGVRVEPGPPEIRRMLIPLGPVAVFGASNFPLAFSVPGGDTASALAAGCPVVVKAHPAHPETGAIAAAAIESAVAATSMPAGTFALVGDPSIEVGQRLAADERIEAVAFTGSQRAGRALFDIAARRPRPIPVYAEMGSVNPVFVLPGAARSRPAEIAGLLAGSITQGAGQFCTQPGVVVTTSPELVDALAAAIAERPAATMLTDAIADQFALGVRRLLDHGARLLAGRGGPGEPTLVAVSASQFEADPELREEVFGPVSVVVTVDDAGGLFEVAGRFRGELTATVFGDDEPEAAALVALLARRVGRIVYDGVPTGVAVNSAMQHGGPYPASTDARSTSVGTAAIERFLRPVAFQNVPASIPFMSSPTDRSRRSGGT